MKRKTSVLLAAMIAICMGTTSCGVFLPEEYEPREFLNKKDFGEKTQMPDPYFTWADYRVLTNRMRDASEINMRREYYVDFRGYIEGGEFTKTVTELKTVLYSDYVVESALTIDGELTEVQTLSLMEQDGEKKLLEQVRDANGNVIHTYTWDWEERVEWSYYQYLLENTKMDDYLRWNSYNWSYYKNEDIYSSYAKESHQFSSDFRDANEEFVPCYQESEYLIQLKINDSTDRFEKKYMHLVNYIKQDYEGNIIIPYVYSETITEFTAVYGTKKTYDK